MGKKKGKKKKKVYIVSFDGGETLALALLTRVRCCVVRAACAADRARTRGANRRMHVCGMYTRDATLPPATRPIPSIPDQADPPPNYSPYRMMRGRIQ